MARPTDPNALGEYLSQGENDWRTVLTTVFGNMEGTTVGTYFANQAGTALLANAADVAAASVLAVYLDPADYAVGGRSVVQVRVRAAVSVNGTASTTTFTFNLVPVTVSGGAGLWLPTAGTTLATSGAIVNPTINLTTVATGTPAVLAAAGLYAVDLVTTAATIAASSSVHAHAVVQVKATEA